MLKVYNSLIISFTIFSLVSIVHTTTFAQLCTGTSNSNCPTNTHYNCNTDQFGAHCAPLFGNGAGYACGAYAGANSCVACVPNNQICSLADSSTGYTPCAEWSGPSCDTCIISWDSSTYYSGCGGLYAQLCSGPNIGCVNYCTSGTTNCGVCTGGTRPANTCGNTTSNTSQTCQHNAPQTCTNQNFTQTGCTEFIDNCATSAGYSCTNGSVCTTNINTHVIVDYNHNQQKDGSDYGLAGVTVTDGSANYTTNSNGDFSFTGKTTGTYTIGITVPAGYQAVNSSSQAVSLTNTSGNVNVYFYITPLYKITGYVYVDYNHNGTPDSEPNYTSSSLQVTDGSDTVSTDGAGNFTLPQDLISGTYTVSLQTIPANYKGVTSSQSITVGPNGTSQLGITPLYFINGAVYNDQDAGNCYNPSLATDPTFVTCTDYSQGTPIVHGPGTDTYYTTSSTSVTITGNGVNQTLTQGTGQYKSGQVLESGQYTVTYTNIPTNYHMTYPTATVPPSFTVTVGTPATSIACTTHGYNDAGCDTWGNVGNLNFGMNNHISHPVYPCTDVRDETSTQDFIPNSATCGIISGNYAIVNYNNLCPTGTGIYSSGAITPDFGFGQASPDNWLLGGATAENFTPVNPGVIRTSTSYLNTTLTENGVAATDLANVCTPSDCYLPDNLAPGLYSYPFDTTFVGTKVTGGGTVDGTYTFPAGNYVFIIGDSTHQSDTTFKTKMLVSAGSTATFSTSKDMHVDPSVGESSITSTAGDLEGFYSADESFYIDSSYVSSNRCTDTGSTKDLRFNLIGSVVVNAGGTGGSLTNNRDLCAGDLSCPTYTIGNTDGSGGGGGSGSGLGFSYILNAPDILKHKNFFWQELAP